MSVAAKAFILEIKVLPKTYTVWTSARPWHCRPCKGFIFVRDLHGFLPTDNVSVSFIGADIAPSNSLIDYSLNGALPRFSGTSTAAASHLLRSTSAGSHTGGENWTPIRVELPMNFETNLAKSGV